MTAPSALGQSDVEPATTASSLERKLDTLLTRLEKLENEVQRRSSGPSAPLTTPESRREDVSRRGLLAKSGAVALGAAAASAGLAARPADADANSGQTLVQYMDFDGPISGAPPLSSDVTWTRTDARGGSGTREILSLISSNTAASSFAWPLFVELQATTSPSATLANSHSTAIQCRAYNRSTGSPWVACLHLEPHHGEFENNGAAVPGAQGITVGMSCEVTRKASGGTCVGVEVMSTGPSSSAPDAALQIDSASGGPGWATGIKFVGSGNGNIGIDFQNSYSMGIDLKNNDLRMNKNRKILLEASGSVFLRYNDNNGRIELVKGYTNVVASW